MKYLVLNIALLLFGSIVSISVNRKHDFLKDILLDYDIDIDTKLINLFPNMEGIEKVQALHNNDTELNDCYNMEIGDHTYNIFTDSLYTIIHHYFQTHHSMISRMKFASKVPIFLSNLEELGDLIIECVNNPDPAARSKYGLTLMSIYSKDEFLNDKINQQQSMVLSDSKSYKNPEICSIHELSSDKPTPEKFNWADKGYVTPVRNQAQCGSCYIFAAIGAMESQYMIKVEKKPIDLSEQALLNCLDYGCDGGHSPVVMEEMINTGVSLEKDAPYAKKVKSCKNYPIFMKGDYMCEHYDLQNHHIKRLILRNGPAVVYINADKITFLIGEFNSKCKSKETNHAVLLVGWNEKYWIIKNSWTKYWGKKGYLYMPIKDCNCGLNQMFVQIVKKHLN